METIFFVGLSLLFTHELDAMTAKEWRILPILSRLDDEVARRAFVLLHVPLFAIIFLGVMGPDHGMWRYVADIFFIGHAGAHIALHRHANNGFKRPMSWLLIGGAGFMGALDLLWRHNPEVFG